MDSILTWDGINDRKQREKENSEWQSQRDRGGAKSKLPGGFMQNVVHLLPKMSSQFLEGTSRDEVFGYFSTLMLHKNKLGLKWRYRVNADCNITAGIISGRNHPTWNWVSQLVKNINPQLEQGSDYRFVHSYFQLMCLTQVKVTIKIT